jgi:hypothetical protein
VRIAADGLEVPSLSDLLPAKAIAEAKAIDTSLGRNGRLGFAVNPREENGNLTEVDGWMDGWMDG